MEVVTGGTLYVVSTPIGNMGDFSFRAVETLRAVDVVLAEDTRHTRHLLNRYEIERPLIAYHEHNEAKTAPGLVARLVAGESFALVTDAGTPLVSDPGLRLTQRAIAAGVRVVPIPGASAVLAALVASGLDPSAFTFFGFLPRTGRARQARLAEAGALAHTVVLFESAARLHATLGDMDASGMGERACAVAREMTKQFEEVRRGTVRELAAYYGDVPAKGEVVIMLGGAERRLADEATVRERVRAARASGLSARDAATLVARELGVSRRDAYRLTRG